MNLRPNLGIFDCRSLLEDLMSADAAGQYFAHQQLVFFSTHWMMLMYIDSASPQISEVHYKPEGRQSSWNARPDQGHI